MGKETAGKGTAGEGIAGKGMAGKGTEYSSGGNAVELAMQKAPANQLQVMKPQQRRTSGRARHTKGSRQAAAGIEASERDRIPVMFDACESTWTPGKNWCGFGGSYRMGKESV